MPLQSWGALLDEAGDTSFTVLPAADYDLKMVKVEAKMAKSSGKLMFSYTADVTSGPYKGRKLFGNLVVSPENPTALNIFFRQMAAIGVPRDFFTNNPSDSQVAEALLNREFRGQVAIKPYLGEDRNEIKSYSPISKTLATPGATPPPPMATGPAPTNAPRTAATGAPAPAPQAAPPAAAAATPQTAPQSAPAPEPVTQAPTPPVADAVNTEQPPAAPAGDAPVPPTRPF